MKILMIVGVMAGTLVFGLAGCKSTSTSSVPDEVAKTCAISGYDDGAKKNCPMGKTKSACASCAAGKAGDATWCDKCDKGYIDGQAVKCKGCFIAKTGGPACEVCMKNKPKAEK